VTGIGGGEMNMSKRNAQARKKRAKRPRQKSNIQRRRMGEPDILVIR
jgi:hypothetical protein